MSTTPDLRKAAEAVVADAGTVPAMGAYEVAPRLIDALRASLSAPLPLTPEVVRCPCCKHEPHTGQCGSVECINCACPWDPKDPPRRTYAAVKEVDFESADPREHWIVVDRDGVGRWWWPPLPQNVRCKPGDVVSWVDSGQQMFDLRVEVQWPRLAALQPAGPELRWSDGNELTFGPFTIGRINHVPNTDNWEPALYSRTGSSWPQGALAKEQARAAVESRARALLGTAPAPRPDPKDVAYYTWQIADRDGRVHYSSAHDALYPEREIQEAVKHYAEVCPELRVDVTPKLTVEDVRLVFQTFASGHAYGAWNSMPEQMRIAVAVSLNDRLAALAPAAPDVGAENTRGDRCRALMSKVGWPDGPQPGAWAQSLLSKALDLQESVAAAREQGAREERERLRALIRIATSLLRESGLRLEGDPSKIDRRCEQVAEQLDAALSAPQAPVAKNDRQPVMLTDAERKILARLCDEKQASLPVPEALPFVGLYGRLTSDPRYSRQAPANLSESPNGSGGAPGALTDDPAGFRACPITGNLCGKPSCLNDCVDEPAPSVETKEPGLTLEEVDRIAPGAEQGGNYRLWSWASHGELRRIERNPEGEWCRWVIGGDGVAEITIRSKAHLLAAMAWLRGEQPHERVSVGNGQIICGGCCATLEINGEPTRNATRPCPDPKEEAEPSQQTESGETPRPQPTPAADPWPEKFAKAIEEQVKTSEFAHEVDLMLLGVAKAAWEASR